MRFRTSKLLFYVDCQIYKLARNNDFNIYVITIISLQNFSWKITIFAKTGSDIIQFLTY